MIIRKRKVNQLVRKRFWVEDAPLDDQGLAARRVHLTWHWGRVAGWEITMIRAVTNKGWSVYYGTDGEGLPGWLRNLVADEAPADAGARA